VLVVGLSDKSAPVATLERAAVSGDTLGKLLRDLSHTENVAGVFVVSTCNRVEVYADVDRFHGGVTAICELLAQYSGIPTSELTSHLYVHYEDRAVMHLLAVACGLESMVVGEAQILGQVRKALKLAREAGALGRVLSDLGRMALRTGKRAHAETGIDRLGASLVSLGIECALGALSQRTSKTNDPERIAGPLSPDGEGVLSGRRVLVVGAGSMSALAAATAARNGAATIAVANRTYAHAQRLAVAVGGTAADLAELPGALADADLVISCTGASGLVITPAIVSAALAARVGPSEPLVLLDLAMPRDVDPAVADLPGVRVISMETLSDYQGSAASSAAGASTDEVAAVRAIVDEELAAHVSAVHAARVTPTVVALRAKAAGVVDTELARLEGRLSSVDGLSSHALDEVAQTVRRVVDKLLHAPTVRVKELAGSPGGEEYATALRVLFDLDPRAVEAVTLADTGDGAATDQEGRQ
jgi:glutamyl-tRNA reductase